MNTLKIVAIGIAVSSTLSAQSFSRSFLLPSTNGVPIGLENNGNDSLLFTDLGSQPELGLADINGMVTLTADLSSNSPSPLGVTTNGTSAIWVTDSSGTEVDRYDSLGNYVSSFSVAGPITFPEGITFNPTTGNLYVTDGVTPRVVEFTPLGAVVNTFPLNGASVDGIAYDPADGSYWIYDSGTDSLRNYGPSFVQRSSIPGTIANGFSPGEGVAVVGDEIFVVSTGSSEVVVFMTNPVLAEAGIYGQGCPPTRDFYEQFFAGSNDLSGSSITIRPFPNGFAASNTGSFDPNFSNNLGSGDDTLFAAQPLGFTATFPGLGTLNAIDIDSNGRIGFGLAGSDFTETVGEFLDGTMVAVCWDDLNPAAGGGVFFDIFPTFAMVTWNQVPQFGDTDSNTFQVKLYRDGRIECSYQSVGNDAIVGLSSSVSNVDPGSLDLSADLPITRTGPGTPLTLTPSNTPIIGTTFDMVTTNIPPGTIGAGVIIGSAPTIVTSPLLPTGCSLLSNGDITTLPINPAGGTSSIVLPNSQALLGVSLFAQSAVLVPTLPAAIPVLVSNGLQIDVGEI